MTPMLTGRTDKLDFAFDKEVEEGLFYGPVFTKPIHVEGCVTQRASCMLLTLKAEVSYTSSCARCLKELNRSLTFELSKNVAVSGSLNNDDNDDYVIIDGSFLDIDEAVNELLFLEMPSRDLCSDDCLGLCFKCGKNLNEGSCGCVTKEIDPRLAVLSKFLTENEDDN